MAKVEEGRQGMTTGGQTGLIFVLFERPWIDAQDTSNALEMLGSLVRTAEDVIAHAGQLVFNFDGWDDDPRELPQIPEVKQWFRKLTDQFPYWFILCSRDYNVGIPLALALLQEGEFEVIERAGVRAWTTTTKAAGLEPILRQLFDGQNALAEKFGISLEQNKSWTQQVSACLDRFTAPAP